MAFLLAGLGHPRTGDWILGIGASFGPLYGEVLWQDEDAVVAMGVVGRRLDRTASLGEASGVVAAVVGRIDGAAEGSAAVLEAYTASRIGGLSRLRGEYAYALWDPTERALLAGCDAVGFRGLAYMSTGQGFVFSSSATMLLRHPVATFGWDPVFVAHVLSGLWAPPTARTAFRGVKRMIGGQGLRITSGGVQAFEADRLVFDVPARAEVGDAVRGLGEAVDRAVARDEAEEPAVALSGGVDSSIVATSMIKRQPALHAFSLVAPEGTQGRAPALDAVLAALPGVTHHPVVLSGTETLASGAGLPADDPISAGPLLQAGRAALLRAVREAGFACVFDGEGGDELFDILWRPGDILRDKAVMPLFSGLAWRGRRRALAYDILWMVGGPASRLLISGAIRRLRASRPWLRAGLWDSEGFVQAAEDAISFGQAASARDRLQEVLGGHGRYWRVQELTRHAADVRGISPLLSRHVIEFVGSLRPRIAIDLRHRKVLLRRLAAERLPAKLAWYPKREPLSDWLIGRWIGQDANIARTIAQIKGSALLREQVDVHAFAASAARAVRLGVGPPVATVVEFAALVEWIAAVEGASLAG